jgi:DNA adenine methylase
MGSKARLAKHILPIILAERGERVWAEPFVGGANITQFVTGKRECYDLNEYVTACLDAASKGWLPKETYSEQDYADAKLRQAQRDKSNLAEDGWIGFACSFGGKFFGGFARNSADRTKKVKECSLQQFEYALKQFPLLQDVKFEHKDYRDIVINEPALIYCDPPYKSTTGYKVGGFNHDEFYEWCCKQVDNGHIVFVSEYKIEHPRFKCVFEKEQKSAVRRADGVINTERLYKVV